MAAVMVLKAINTIAPLTNQLFQLGRSSSVKNSLGRLRSATSKIVVKVVKTMPMSSGA